MNLSRLNHTWLIDLDGTIFEHNGYLTGNEKLLPGVKEFWDSIPLSDTIILLTARSEDYKKETIEALNRYEIRYAYIIFNLPTGERILINDQKPSGLDTAISVNVKRDVGLASIKINTTE